MKGYRVTFIKPKVAELRSFELRKPKDNEVMVKVKYTLISAGTEKAYLSGANNTAQKFPTVPGYSSVGTVVEIGSAVQSSDQATVYLLNMQVTHHITGKKNQAL